MKELSLQPLGEFLALAETNATRAALNGQIDRPEQTVRRWQNDPKICVDVMTGKVWRVEEVAAIDFTEFDAE